MEKKDYIEKFIEENMELFSNAEPADGHFERFEEKLKILDSKRKFNSALLWKIAAAVVFAFLAVNQTLIWLKPADNRNVSLATYSPQYRDVEFYYTSAINASLSQWEKFNRDGMVSETENEMMQNELQAFEKMHLNLQKELKANPYDDRVINAMLEFYQSKLSIISMVVEKLKEVQTINNQKSHEIKM